MMTHTTQPSMPTPVCAAFEMLLPLLGTDALTTDEARATREHVETCAWCQAQLAAYEALDDAARRHYSSDPSPAAITRRPPLTLEDIMRSDEAEAMPSNVSVDATELEIPSPAPNPLRANLAQRPKRWRPWRLAEIAAVLVVALLAATLLVTRPGPLSGRQPNQPPLKSPAGAVVFADSVSWGRLQLNGQAISVTTDGHYPLYLPRGENTLTYDAPPLPRLTCTISAPASPHDTCHIFADQRYQQANSWFSGRIIDLEAVPDHLTTAQREVLRTAAQQALDAHTVRTTIQPGDHYLTPGGKILTATQAFPIALSYHLDAADISASLYPCVPTCNISQPSSAFAPTWTITPTIRWEYVDQHGVPETVQQRSGTDSAFGVEVTWWQNSWHVTLRPGTPDSVLCGVTTGLLQKLVGSVGSRHGWGMSCGTQLLSQEGILLVETTLTNSTSQDGTEKQGYVFYRAGAVIALDANAHTLFPSLPGPSAHELAIAREIGFKG